MKQFYRVFLFSLICILVINLVGCCGSSGGHGNSDNITDLPDAVAGSDGSLYYDHDGLRLSAMPGTFDPKAVIKIRKQANNQLDALNLSGKGVSAVSALYHLDFQTNNKLLYNSATASLILDSALSSSKKGYFGLERSAVRLVTSEQQMLTSNTRASANNNVFNLPFLETFKKIALVTVDKEKLTLDPTLSTDSAQKNVENSKYTSNTHVELDVATVDTLDNSMTHGKNASVKLLLKGENVEFYKTAATLSSKSQETAGDKKLYSASIDLFENSTMVSLNNHTVNFNLDLNSANLEYDKLPRRLVLEGCYTGSDNLPICSQEYVIFYNSPIKPYVISTSPSNGSKVYGLTKVTVNFSEPMNPDTVSCSIKSSVDGSNPTLSNYTWNGNCLTMTAKLDKKAVYTVTVNKNATSKTGTKLAPSMYGDNADYVWSFTYDPHSFFVELTTPPHGSTNVDTQSDDNTKQGPDIILTFSEQYHPYTTENLITLTKSADAKKSLIKCTPHPYTNESIFILTPDKPLEFMTEYTITVSKSVNNISKKSTLPEDYIATFTTSSGFASGNGTSASPFMITNQRELANVGNKTYVDKNYYFKVANDINYDLSIDDGVGFTPLGSKTAPFIGHFDGNNKKLNNFITSINHKDFAGLFGIVNNSTMSNVIITNAKINGHENLGILAGNIKNTKVNNIKINNPTFESGADYIGGIIGSSDNSSITDTETVCNEHNMIAGNQDYVGGIVGSADNTKIVNASVTIDLGGGDKIGGIAGYMKNSVLQKCNAKVKIVGEEHNIGGLVGLMSGSSINTAKVLDESYIEGNNSTGGLVGTANSGSEIIKCSVSAKSVTGAQNVGGLLGNLGSSSIENSCVFSRLTVKANGDNAGGLVGKAEGDSNLLRTYSNASISGVDNTGGLVGCCNNNSKVTIQYSIANNNLVESSTKDTMYRIVGYGTYATVNLNKVLALKTTKFRIVGNDPKDTEPQEHVLFNGTTLDKITKEKFIELGFEGSIWDFSKETPFLK